MGRVVGSLYCLDDLSFSSTVLEHFNKTNVFQQYVFDSYKHTLFSTQIYVNTVNKELWHSRLGHPSDLVLNQLPFSNEFKNSENKCYVCPMDKQTKLSFPSSSIQTKKPFELVHIDIRGPYHTSLSGANYFLTLVDDFTRSTWTYLMTYKTQACSILTSFANLIQNQFSTTIKAIRSDNGAKFLRQSCQSLFDSLGIIHHKTSPYTPQQNGVVERKHRHLLQITMALLFQSGLPIQFWGEALLHATF